ncbi:hypothetical protein TYRP_019099 [Tyrophagus putrescentiae]|nr:hypothetical protein TYRP_019099 [Tyrophagus putrescentiae]
MPPVQNMTDNCDLPHGDSQFAQNLTCLRDSEKTRHHLDAAAHQDSDAPPASNIALESTTMNGDVHLDELADSVQQPDKKPTADEPSGPCDEGPEDDSPVTNENSNNIPSTAECEGSLDDFADFEGYSDLNLSNSPQVNNSEDHTVDCSASNLESKNFANFEGHSHWPTLAADTQAQPPADDDAFDDDDDFADFETKAKANETAITSPDEEFQSVISLNQDLDFFESKYSYKNSSISSNTKPSNDLISEFENIILDNGKAQFNQEESKQAALSATSPASSVNDLRKMLQNTIAKTNNEQVLSAEALHILNELPRLNFARANVLMWNVNEHSAPNG